MKTIPAPSTVAMALLVSFLGVSHSYSAALVDFDFSGVAGNVSQNKTAFELTAVSELAPVVDLVQGINIFSPSVLNFVTAGGQPSNDMNLNNWGIGSTLADGINGNRFVSYTIAPKPGQALYLNGGQLSFDFWRNGANAPKDYYILVNTDGGSFTTSHAVGARTGITNTNVQQFSVTLPDTGFSGLEEPVEVRLYGLNANLTSGNTHLTGAGMTAGPILATDFDARTISGATASNLTWTRNGVDDPGNLTASHSLFNTTDAQDKFAVAQNIGNTGPWTVDVPLSVLDKPIDLDEIAMDVYIFSNAGGFQGVNRDVDVTVRLLDDGMNELWAGSVLDIYPNSGSINPPQPRSISLDLTGTDRLLANTDYTLQIEASSSVFPDGGNNAGIDNLFLSGLVVPEPGTWILLLSAAACGLLLRRRHAPWSAAA